MLWRWLVGPPQTEGGPARRAGPEMGRWAKRVGRLLEPYALCQVVAGCKAALKTQKVLGWVVLREGTWSCPFLNATMGTSDDLIVRDSQFEA